MSEPLLHRVDLGWRNSTIAGVLRLRPALAQHSEAEGALIERLATGATTIVEIGVAEGGSAWHARRTMDPAGRMVLIDTYPRRFGLNLSSLIARRVVAREPRGRVEWLHERSDAVAPRWTGEIDFLFIDGDHAYDAVKRDFDDWSPHVAADGVMLFHDALLDASWMDDGFGSARFVQELRGSTREWTLVDSADSLAAFRRA